MNFVPEVTESDVLWCYFVEFVQILYIMWSDIGNGEGHLHCEGLSLKLSKVHTSSYPPKQMLSLHPLLPPPRPCVLLLITGSFKEAKWLF